MPRIQFTAAPKLPRDIAHLPYVKGYAVDLTADQADRWVRRGVAVYVPDLPPAKLAPPEASAIVAAGPAALPADITTTNEPASAGDPTNAGATRPLARSAGRSPAG